MSDPMTPSPETPRAQQPTELPEASPPQVEAVPTEPPAPAAPAQPERPKPAYGEYAPEGWVSPVQQPTENAASAPVTGATTPPAQPTQPTIAGVPHNLGIGSSTAGQPPAHAPHITAPPVADQTQQTGAPTAPPYYGAQSTPQPQHTPQQAAPVYQQPHAHNTGQGAAPAPTRKPGAADRVITIMLLVIGAFGALNLAYSAMTLGQQMRMIAVAAGMEDLQLPASFNTLQTVGAISVLSLYAIVLLWSIARLRAKKITFWLPLAGGLVAFVLVFVLAFIAMLLVPELSLSITPETLERLLNNMGSMQ